MIPKKSRKYYAFGLLILTLCEVCAEEKSSLTFVIDDTFSMSDDIEQVKIGANAIFDTVLKSNESQIEDFVLVTFNDPDTALRTITKDRNVFKNALSSINVHGGGDCPEYSMSGIITGIVNSRPGSTIYVFTDASAKDYTQYNEIKNLCIKNQIQVVFVLTGLCNTKSSIDYKVYESLAKDTEGQVFHLHKQDIGDILVYVMENVKGRRTTLATAKFPPGIHKLNFTVDGQTKDPTVSVSGEKPTLNITGPDGSKADSKTLVHQNSISIAILLDPIPGIHTVEVGSESESHVIVSARTKVKFQHGFSTFKPSSIKDTTTRPLPDIKSHITIKLTDGDIKLKTIKILDMDDKLVKELSLDVLNEKEKLYVTKQEDLPNTMFKIAITGYDPLSDETITRVLPPIEPQPKIPVRIINKAPTVSISGNSTLKVDRNEPLQLACKVIGYPQPNIVWLNKDSGEELRANVSVVEIPDYFISILYIDRVRKTTNYECKANNIEGFDSKTIAVETLKYYLGVMRKPEDTVINYHDEGEIYCKVDAYPPVAITWYKNWKPLLKNDNIEFSDDNSVIKIKEMNPSDDGFYVCEIRNSYMRKILSAKITITGVENPKIDKTTQAIQIQHGSDAVINCNIIQGYPKSNITWYFDDGFTGQLKTLEEWSNIQSIKLRNVSKSNAGAYSCFAENAIGNDYHEVELSVEYAPTIERDLEEIKAIKGETVSMSCYVDGVPEPVVTWYKNNITITRDDKIYINSDHSIRMKVGVGDSGIYSCNATNKFGTASRIIKVDVHVPVTITIPKISKMDVKVGTTLRLPCQAKGYPTPETEWTYHSFNSSVPPKSLLKSFGSVMITLRNIQLTEDGYYTCTASNGGGQTNITYEIHVLAPPIINMYTNKKIRAVEGDLVVLIKCNASGNPPPVIKWLKNGFWVATGDDFIIEHGTLIMKNIKKKDEGVYVCEAKNSLGTDTAVYDVKVDKSPRPDQPTSTIVINENDTSHVRCDVPHKRTDQLRWYKDDVLIHTGELTITNAKVVDSGLYTCRVSDFARSTSGNTMVTVGFKPKFTSDEEENIEYVESTPYALSCEASGDPEPKFTWWHNGEIINETESFHYFEMEAGTQGQYICDARNEFGNVVRSFNIISKDCLIDIKKKPSNKQPLMLSPTLNWPQYEVKNGFMSIANEKYVYLFCPNRFKLFPQAYNVAFCKGGTKFNIRGQSYDFSNIECTENVIHSIERTGESCFSGNTELLKVIFKVLSYTIEAYEVCLDKDNNRPLYTNMRMSSSVADVDYLGTDWSDDDEIALSLDDAYECNRQINVTSSVLGRWFHRDDGCCFAKRQLVSSKDLLPGIAQKAAYSHLNVVPHWSTCNLESNNWKEVEQRVRTLAKATYSELQVSTGVAEDLTLPDSYRSEQDIFITDSKNHRQAVPKYLWKVVQDPATSSSLVIIQVNVPDLLPSEAAKYVRCRDICNTTKWMKGSTWYDVTRGFTYCCSLEDFEEHFGYRGVFDPYKRILKDVSVIPEHSLS